MTWTVEQEAASRRLAVLFPDGRVPFRFSGTVPTAAPVAPRRVVRHPDAPRRLAPLPDEARQHVLGVGAVCACCGTHDNLTVDHVVPQARGGTHDLDNLRALCRRCNSKKWTHDRCTCGGLG